jgi:hypothetical protein
MRCAVVVEEDTGAPPTPLIVFVEVGTDPGRTPVSIVPPVPGRLPSNARVFPTGLFILCKLCMAEGCAAPTGREVLELVSTTYGLEELRFSRLDCVGEMDVPVEELADDGEADFFAGVGFCFGAVGGAGLGAGGGAGLGAGGGAGAGLGAGAGGDVFAGGCGSTACRSAETQQPTIRAKHIFVFISASTINLEVVNATRPVPTIHR